MIKKNIHYSKGKPVTRHMLDVAYDDVHSKRPVVIFIHGGSWMTGSKDMYTPLGENLVKLGYVTVIINYRLAPSVNVSGMVEDCQEAFDWIVQHISEFGGDPKKLFLMGHSAGGHLSAVTGLINNAGTSGMILVDAFGLSAYYFLTHHGMWIPDFLTSIFGTDPALWEKVSPDKLAGKDMPPVFILTGGNTYPFLLYDNQHFSKVLMEHGHEAKHKVYPGRSHMEMIRMFESASAEAYRDIDSWMKLQRSSL